MPFYLLIFGRQPEFGFAEAFACVQQDGGSLEPFSPCAAILSGIAEPGAFFHRLGGSVKLIQIIPDVSESEVIKILQKQEGKIVFGVSVYGKDGGRKSETRSRKWKEELEKRGRPVRYITAKDGVLSSVVVQKQLLHKGGEWVFVEHGGKALFGKTVAVQDFEEFSKRDYGRPGRDARDGMLPPKLARIMVNLAGMDRVATLLDTFCGSGTVLQEAALLGYTNLIGSDSSEAAVKRTKQNLMWLKQTSKLFHTSVTALEKELHGKKIDAIVTEPFLGPPQRGSESISRIIDDLVILYNQTFRAFEKILRSGGRVIFVFPVFFRKTQIVPIPNIDRILGSAFRFIPPIPENAKRTYRKNLSPRQTLLYHRPGQWVGREVVVVEKR